MKRICVFCGSKTGTRPAYLTAAAELAKVLAARDIGIVYGGASVGTMGSLADAGLAAGAEVIGVIPRSLKDREIAHAGLSELYVVDTLLERKRTMLALADGFVTLPGGLGTMDELFEVLTWSVLGYHDKPIGVVDIAGYYAPLLAFLDHGVDEGFIHPADRARVMVASTPGALIERMAALPAKAPE